MTERVFFKKQAIIGIVTVLAILGLVLASTSRIFAANLTVDFAQCANNSTEGAGNCAWIGSILHAPNSTYYEGMSVPQRVLYRNIETNGAHTFSFDYSYTKGGIHAYDFITSPGQGNSGFAPGVSDATTCQGLSGPNLTACSALISTTPNLVDIVGDSFDSKDSAPVPGTGSSQATKETNYETETGSNRNLEVYSDGTISATSTAITHSVAANGDTGDSDAKLTMNFTISGCSVADPCNLMIFFGGHLAKGGINNNTGSNWGPGLGSSNISGGPYHVKNLSFDGAGGSLDNQIQGASILTPQGSITLDKVTLPSGDLTNFNFATTNLPTPISPSLADGTTPVAWNNLADGTYTITEAVPGGWELTSKSCTGGSDSVITPIANGLQIALADGEDLVCTFTNTDLPTLRVNKVVINDNGGTKQISDFPLFADGNSVTSGVTNTSTIGQHVVSETADPTYAATISGDCDAQGNVTLAAGQDKVCTITNNDIAPTLTLVKTVVNNNGGTKQVSDFPLFIDGSSATSGVAQPVSAGAHTATETTSSGYTPSAWGQDCAANGTITLALAENKTCTITNDDQPGQLIVKKTTVPAADTTAFAISATGSGTITGGGTGSITDALDQSYEVTPGTYSVAETVPADWSETSNTCVNVAIALGEIKECTITNTKRAKLIVQKQTNPDGSQQTFAFSASYDGDGFSLSDGQSNDSGFLLPGTYAVTENTPAGWDLTNVTCSDTSDPSAVELSPGETVTCIFTNTQDAKIIVTKQTDPDGDTTGFNFSSSYDGDGFVLSDGQNNDSGDLDPGTYSVSETVPAGWDLESSTCDDGSDPASIALAAGETVTCTFTNEKDANIIVVKQTDPDGDPQSFAFTASYNGAGFSLSDGQSNDSGDLDPGAYSVTETLPAGWDQASATCSDGSTVGNIVLAAGETITCTFSNTKRGHLIVQKTTAPAGDPTVFTVNASGTGTITGGGAGTVTDATDKDYEVTPGTYSVNETVPVGWDKTGDTCQNVIVAAGQTATCLLTNTKQASLTIVKNADPNDLIDFNFTGSGAIGNFILDDDAGVADIGQNGDINRPQSNTTSLTPGSYTVTETLPNGFWQHQGVVCVDSNQQPYAVVAINNGMTVDLTSGVTVTCTFTNVKANPTRTLGFWQTHTAFTTSVFNAAPLNGSMLIGDGGLHKGPVDSSAKIFGAFYSNIAKKTDGKQRTATDKARMVLLQQLVAAKLNCAAFGCTATIQTMITNADSAYASGNLAAMTLSTAQLDAYNNSGDTITISPAGSATPQVSKATANFSFWDQP